MTSTASIASMIQATNFGISLIRPSLITQYLYDELRFVFMFVRLRAYIFVYLLLSVYHLHIYR